MLPWMRRWLGWAMTELPWSRARPADQAVHLHYEKAGLKLSGPPIPWNADAVVVEVLLKLPPSARVRADFTLRVPGWPIIPAESLRVAEATQERSRLLFKLSVPRGTTSAEILWKQKLLGVASLPVLTRDEFFQQLKLINPTVSVRLPHHTVTAQAPISRQCQGIVIAALLRSTVPLVPLAGVPFHVHYGSDTTLSSIPVCLTPAQLASKETLVVVVPPRKPKRAENWAFHWQLDGRTLHHHELKPTTPKAFLKSVRLIESRFVWSDSSGRIQVTKTAPPAGQAVRLGPCFILASRLPNSAGELPLRVLPVVSGPTQPPELASYTVLVTDGPTIVAPGLVELSELPDLVSFELRCGKTQLGSVLLAPIPQAKFNAEGGFEPVKDFAWTSLAEEELAERMQKLFGEGKA